MDLDVIAEKLIEALNAINDVRSKREPVEIHWKKDLESMRAENKADTMEVFKVFTGDLENRKRSEEIEFCKTRCIASLEKFFDEPLEAQLLDDALKHLERFIELSRR